MLMATQELVQAHAGVMILPSFNEPLTASTSAFQLVVVFKSPNPRPSLVRGLSKGMHLPVVPPSV